MDEAVVDVDVDELAMELLDEVDDPNELEDVERLVGGTGTNVNDAEEGNGVDLDAGSEVELEKEKDDEP